jgi:hypothetical protein
MMDDVDMRENQVVLDARFVWDDGRGESSCSALYLDTRTLQRVVAGKVAEARLNQHDRLAAELDAKSQALARKLVVLREAGHLGQGTAFKGSEFRHALSTATPENLRLV